MKNVLQKAQLNYMAIHTYSPEVQSIVLYDMWLFV